MKVYALVGGFEQFIDEAGDGPPNGWIEMKSQRPDSIEYTAQEDGTWIITDHSLNIKLTEVENLWRDTEMPRARETVVAIQFGDAGIVGSEQAWKDYWLSLRKWTGTNPDFPDSTKRPVAPT